MYGCESPNKKMHVHLGSFMHIYFLDLKYNICAKLDDILIYINFNIL